MDSIPAGLGVLDQHLPVAAGERGLDGEIDSLIEILGRSGQYHSAGRNCRSGRVERIQIAGNRIRIEQTLAALKPNGPSERRLARAIGPSNQRKSRHALSSGAGRHFANNPVVLAGRLAGQPFDFETPAIRLLHHVQTFLVQIEDRQTGGQGIEKGLVGGGSYGFIKLRAAEFVARGQDSF